MEVTIGFWVIPTTLSVIIWVWICNGFDYRGDYNFTPIFTLPLGAFLTCFVWMIYFAVLYFAEGTNQ